MISSSSHRDNATSTNAFSPSSVLAFSVQITNTGSLAGSYVPQVYLLNRISSITRPVRQLVAFRRVYLEAGETKTVTMEFEVSRYLAILDRRYEWTVEKGDYTFAVMENGGEMASTGMNVTLTCV